ncbi:Gfo/Idh/MocA family protein [Zavarzinella formosa]|uniref:Gfo/Idh/MocA family protein n=1 Tax=Zavarzinella formosa TaxID=360055 RepID=UPI0002E7F62B|nr:Gfo/Idh/MocA family oxidoreductase [Zavarzinella formosa]
MTAAGLLGAGLLNVETSLLKAGQEVPLAPPDKQPTDVKLPDLPPERKVGIAIVGLGKLAIEEVLPAFAHSKLTRVNALVSGHPDKAKRIAAAYGVETKRIYDYEHFERLADDPSVDAVYIILPNSMHAEYAIRALKAGKHVLCEKPMASNVSECEQMIGAAKEAKKKLMIAYRLRYEPFNTSAIALCRKRAFGELKKIEAANDQDVKAPNIRLSKALAGGPVGDVGIYCLNATRYLTGEEPIEVTAFAHQPKSDPRFREVPESVAFNLRFPTGVLASCSCSFGTAENRRFRVVGTSGHLTLDNAFGYRGQEMSINLGDGPKQLAITPANHFAAEMDHFAESVLQNTPVRTPGEEGLADMRVIEAIAESVRSGKTVSLKG